MSYSLADFYHCVTHSDIHLPSPPAKVLKAWGSNDGGWAEWNGGFVVRLKNRQYAYIEGWCDTTGWG